VQEVFKTMQAYFHLENAHEREQELNLKLELARLRAERRARPGGKPPLRNVLTGPIRRSAHFARMLAYK
jgi:hypothetical protein